MPREPKEPQFKSPGNQNQEGDLAEPELAAECSTPSDLNNPRDRTNKIESLLEGKQLTRPGTISRRKFLGRAAIGAAIALGGIGVYKAVEKKKPDQKSEVNEIEGCDIKSIAENNSFNAEVQVTGDVQQYVIHIGQMHESSFSADLTDKYAKRIIGIQRDIEAVILELQNKANTGNEVFCEGYTGESYNFLKAISKAREDLSKLDSTTENFCLIASLLQNERREELCYVYFKRLEEMKKHLEESNPNAHGNEKFEKALEIFYAARSESSSGFHEDDIYKKGADTKLFIDGKITIRAAEDEALNKEAANLAERLFEGKLDKKSEDEFNRQSTVSREDMAIQQIVQDLKFGEGGKHRLVLLVFGAAHDFRRAVEKNNQNQLKAKLGLITLKHK